MDRQPKKKRFVGRSGQVKYWAAKFRILKLDVIPNDLQYTQDTQDRKESQAEVVVES